MYTQLIDSPGPTFRFPRDAVRLLISTAVPLQKRKKATGKNGAKLKVTCSHSVVLPPSLPLSLPLSLLASLTRSTPSLPPYLRGLEGHHLVDKSGSTPASAAPVFQLQIWEVIAVKLWDESYDVNADSCRKKFSYLLSRFKETRDHNNRTGYFPFHT